MRRFVAFCLASLPAFAVADVREGTTPAPQLPEKTSPVIGGAPATAGKWPDAAAININDQGTVFPECSGVLVAPTVVLTAAHCNEPQFPIVSVLLKATSTNRPAEGETIPVIKKVSYPGGFNAVDVTVLVLEKPSTAEPRAIASGWARFDIKNAAPVQFVGFGTVTRDASDNNALLNEAQSTITDYNCTTSLGCNEAAKPDGELGAGGGGIDTCPGDSGGPMYLLAPYGTFVAGITSRGYDNNQFLCSEGGIYARPDKVVDWIEMTAGVKVSRGPEPALSEPLLAVRGNAAEAIVQHNDPVSKEHTYAIKTPPAHGTAKLRSDGRLRVCTDPGVAGADKITVTVADKADATRTLDVTLPITIEDGDPGSGCDVDAFEDAGGCCDTSGGGTGTSISLSIVVLLVLRRRR